MFSFDKDYTSDKALYKELFRLKSEVQVLFKYTFRSLNVWEALLKSIAEHKIAD